MHLAVAKLEVKLVIKLIMRDADVSFPDASTGDHPLHLLISVFSKNTVAAKKILNFLVDAGADLNAKNNDQWTPLHLAVKKGCIEAADVLVSRK